jgi:3-deoxy-manno-octulosonate cytidylyltransferase (CMP-KDO synthetase)
MSVAVVIPARYASTRYPGKPLVMLRDGRGHSKPLVERSWDAACAAVDPQYVYVATDDDRIANCVRGFGGQVIMTDPACMNGTERCAQAVEIQNLDAEIIVNFQGDAPLTPPSFVTDLLDAMSAHPNDMVATPVIRCDAQTLQNFQDDRRSGNVGGTTVVFDVNGHGLYFSKEVIPYLPADVLTIDQPIPVFHHVGVYAYRRQAIKSYAVESPTILETLEGLEQLRFLELGIPIRCVEVNADGRIFWELNNPVDVIRIEEALS